MDLTPEMTKEAADNAAYLQKVISALMKDAAVTHEYRKRLLGMQVATANMVSLLKTGKAAMPLAKVLSKHSIPKEEREHGDRLGNCKVLC